MYVSAMQASNSLGNQARVESFMQDCMTAQGWKRVAVEKAPKPVKAELVEPPPEMREKGVQLLAMEDIARACKIRLTRQATNNFKELRSLSNAGIQADARKLARDSMRDKEKSMGRDQACKGARAVLGAQVAK